jgi:hypothetical protein
LGSFGRFSKTFLVTLGLTKTGRLLFLPFYFAARCTLIFFLGNFNRKNGVGVYGGAVFKQGCQMVYFQTKKKHFG